MANHGKQYTWTTATPSHPAPGVASQGRGAAEDDDNDHAFDLKWQKLPMEELFVKLGTWPWGLTSAIAAAARLRVWGANELEPKKQSRLLKLLPLAVEAAAAVAMVVGLARGGGNGALGAALIALLIADLVVGLADRSSAGKSTAAALAARHAPSGRCCWLLRDGAWSMQDKAAVVPGDVIWLMSGDIVPADARLLPVEESQAATTITVDQSALTGDCFPVAKWPGDAVYAGSACAKGEAPAVVVASGAQTYLADAIRLADTTDVDQLVCRRVLGAFRAVWNACVVWACFALLADAVARNLGRYGEDDVGPAMLVVITLVMAGLALADHCEEVTWEERRRRLRVAKHRRDPQTEGLMRNLGELREQGKISEEEAWRCRNLFGVEPVGDELAATLASYLARGRVSAA